MRKAALDSSMHQAHTPAAVKGQSNTGCTLLSPSSGSLFPVLVWLPHGTIWWLKLVQETLWWVCCLRTSQLQSCCNHTPRFLAQTRKWRCIFQPLIYLFHRLLPFQTKLIFWFGCSEVRNDLTVPEKWWLNLWITSTHHTRREWVFWCHADNFSNISAIWGWKRKTTITLNAFKVIWNDPIGLNAGLKHKVSG